MASADTSGWTSARLDALAQSPELEVAIGGTDDRPERWTPIWVVVADGDVYVRTWQRRDSGWYGRAVRSRSARIRVQGAIVDVAVEAADDATRAAVDAAYLSKYGGGGARSVTTDDAAASTLRLAPAEADS